MRVFIGTVDTLPPESPPSEASRVPCSVKLPEVSEQFNLTSAEWQEFR